MTEPTLRYRTDDFVRSCSCRSVGECMLCNFDAEFRALDKLVDVFAAELKKKLRRKALEGYHGWDDPLWPVAQINKALTEHVSRGDPVDVAAFAAFVWNRMERTSLCLEKTKANPTPGAP